MRKTVFSTLLVIALIAGLAFSIAAQERGRPGGESSSSSGSTSGGGRDAPGGGSSGTSMSSTSVSSTSYSTSSAPSRGFSPSYGGGSSNFYSAPRIQGTSFVSLNSYYQFQDLFYFLQRTYFLNPSYFSRFYRNREPLLTPTILKLTVRQPLRQAMEMMQSIDELEAMLQDKQAGKPVDKQAISDKTKEIRDLAKAVRNDEGLIRIDQRMDRETLKSSDFDNLGLEALPRLHDVAQDLLTQLKNMYDDKQPSTVSVQTLRSPSFESLTKGIDRLTKAIDNSVRRL